jgi:hypothetical protein
MAFKNIVEERRQTSQVCRWNALQIFRFIVERVGGATFKHSTEREVQKRAGCGGCDIGVLCAIPFVVKQAAVAVETKNAPCSGQVYQFKSGITGFVPDPAGRRA